MYVMRNILFYQIGEEIMSGQGCLEVDGTQTYVTATVDGVVSKLSVVEHDGALHLFCPVSHFKVI